MEHYFLLSLSSFLLSPSWITGTLFHSISTPDLTPDNCSCLTHHWHLAALGCFKNTNSRDTECAVAVWDEASLAHTVLWLCVLVCVGAPSDLELIVLFYGVLVFVLLICSLVWWLLSCHPCKYSQNRKASDYSSEATLTCTISKRTNNNTTIKKDYV